MRRAQSNKHHPRPSNALPSDDLGVLREGGETVEDHLRRHLLEKDRENDRVCSSKFDYNIKNLKYPYLFP
jgi:hypothetical protein